MKAVVYNKKKGPDSFVYRDVEKPVPSDGEVLVKIHTASLNAADYRSVKLGLIPKNSIFGSDIAGCVEAVGPNTKLFSEGDMVLGDLTECGFGGLAEYAAVPEKYLVKKPAGVSFETAAAVPLASVTALQALRDRGEIGAGKKALIIGVGGGVGFFALILAKYYGAEVTALCSGRTIETIRGLGADHIFNYAETRLKDLRAEYDLILAVNGSYSVFSYRNLLAPGGICVLIGGAFSQMFRFLLLKPLLSGGGRKMRFLSAKPNSTDLEFIIKLVEEGKIQPVIDRGYPLSEAARAFEYLMAGHARGKVIITI